MTAQEFVVWESMLAVYTKTCEEKALAVLNGLSENQKVLVTRGMDLDEIERIYKTSCFVKCLPPNGINGDMFRVLVQYFVGSFDPLYAQILRLIMLRSEPVCELVELIIKSAEYFVENAPKSMLESRFLEKFDKEPLHRILDGSRTVFNVYD